MNNIKLIKNKNPYSDADYIWNNWEIERMGGNITCQRFFARNVSDGRWFWQFTLKKIKEMLPIAETSFNTINPLYREPLY